MRRSCSSAHARRGAWATRRRSCAGLDRSRRSSRSRRKRSRRSCCARSTSPPTKRTTTRRFRICMQAIGAGAIGNDGETLWTLGWTYVRRRQGRRRAADLRSIPARLSRRRLSNELALLVGEDLREARPDERARCAIRAADRGVSVQLLRVSGEGDHVEPAPPLPAAAGERAWRRPSPTSPPRPPAHQRPRLASTSCATPRAR